MPGSHASPGPATLAATSIDHILMVPAQRRQMPPAPLNSNPSATVPSSAAQASHAPITPIDHVLMVPAETGTPGNPVPSGSAIASHGPAPSTSAGSPGVPLTAIDHVLMIPIKPGAHGAGQANSEWNSNLHLHMPPTAGQMLLAGLRLPSSATPGELQLSRTADASFRDPILWSVMAYKSAHTLKVYYKGYLFASYNAVFGRNPDRGFKEWAGDLKTPEGVYQIIEKYRNSRWHWFLRLNYPNSVDRNRYETLLNRGLVPVLAGRRREVGGEIGIHGTDRPRFNRLDLNWTLGCISVDNSAIDALDRLLPIGTVVIINP